MLIAVNYHYLRPSFDAPYPGIHGITPEQFESQLAALARVGTFVGAREILAAVRGTGRLPERAFVVTFDDGLREQFEHAVGILERLRIPAIFFANTAPIAQANVSSVHKIHLLRSHVAPGEFAERLRSQAERRGIAFDVNGDLHKAVEHYKYDDPETARLKYLMNFTLSSADRDALVEVLFAETFGKDEPELSRKLYMDRRQAAELAARGWLGTHAHEHLPLGLLPAAEAERQLDESLELLCEWTGERPFALSYPYGSREASSESVAAAASRLGIEFAFTMERAANPTLAGPLHLARFDNNDLPGGKASRWSAETLFGDVPARTWFAN
jgi:peptidoglycan/xylan/chitin deacetylase (PgdA/CDA1 family)